MSKYGVFSCPYFPVFELYTGKYGPEKNSIFGHFSRTANRAYQPMEKQTSGDVRSRRPRVFFNIVVFKKL